MGLAVLKMGDTHVGHCSVTFNPFHITPFVPIIPASMSIADVGSALDTVQGTIGLLGDGKVYVNGKEIVKNGDLTACGDRAGRTSGTVYVNQKLVFRVGDPTLGHLSYSPEALAEGPQKAIGSCSAEEITTLVDLGKLIPDSFGISMAAPVLNPTVFCG
tara:strand:- start:121 stop:597 length:477 start_codon:yes stop_codon:yes gene_type:complete